MLRAKLNRSSLNGDIVKLVSIIEYRLGYNSTIGRGETSEHIDLTLEIDDIFYSLRDIRP